jgi:hypothetical protein
MAKSDLEMYMTPSAKGYLKAQKPRVNVPQRRATIDPSLSKGKKAAAGAPLASHQIAAPIQETGPEAMSITDGEASTQPQMVTETQQPIENRGSSARYMIQGGGPKIDLSFLVPERANKAFDPSKAIGGENVPYQESKGIGGFFRRMLGDESNRMNIEAQQAQGAEWREAEKEAKAEERLLNRIREQNEPIQKRFEEEMKYRRDKDIRDEIKGYEDEAIKLAREGQEDILKDTDRALRLAGEEEDRQLRARALDIQEKGLKPPRYTPLGNTGLFQTPEGDLGVYEPEVMAIGKMPGRPAGIRMLPKPGSAPVRSVGEAEVDRITGKPIVKSTTPETDKSATSVATPPRMGAWPGVGEVKPDVTGLYYTAEPQGSSTLLKETGAFDVPESVTKEMTQYAMSPEQRMNILKRYQTGLRANRSGFPQFAE